MSRLRRAPQRVWLGIKLTGICSRVYVSGSAYKIVNSRAYHHGTMLISTRLDLLGDLLRVNQVSGTRAVVVIGCAY